MMDEQFDLFPTNMFEMLGKIERNNFNFRCSYYRIWYNGQVIQQGHGGFDVIGIVTDEILDVSVNSHIFDKYAVSPFVMENISLSQDRMLWSSFTDTPSRKVPTALSLFFRRGVLSRVSITIDFPQMLIEMDGYPLDTQRKDENFRLDSNLSKEDNKQEEDRKSTSFIARLKKSFFRFVMEGVI